MINCQVNIINIRLYRFCLFLLLIVIPYSIGISPLNATENELRFSYLTTTNGLSNNRITQIKQDNQGYIWIGTAEGLNRYDGYENKVFKKILNDNTSLADNMIFSMFVDHLGNLWIGTQSGLSLYNDNKENFKTYIFDLEGYRLNTSNKVTGIAEDSKNNLLIATEAGYIYNFDRRKDTFLKENHYFRNIKDFIVDKEDNCWMGGIESLFFYDKKNQIVISFNSIVKSKKSFKIKIVNTICEDGDTIWIGTNEGNVFQIPKKSKSLNLVSTNFKNTYFITDIVRNKKGKLYFSTNDGIFIYNKKKNNYISYVYQQNNPYGLNSLGVADLFEDRQGNLWVGTNQGGVNIATSGKFFNNYNNFSNNIKLNVININAIEEDSQGNLWIGSFNNGINQINLKTGKNNLFLNDEKDQYSLGYGSVYAIFEDSRKNIWTGTYLGFLQKYDPITNKFISFPFFPEKGDSSIGRDIRSILEDQDGNLWLACPGFGMSKFNTKTRTFKYYHRDLKNLNTSLADNFPFQLILDYEKNIWVATPSGLSKFNQSTEKFTNFYHNINDSNSLCHNFVNTIFEDSRKNIWIGTTYGLDFFEKSSNKFIHFFEKDGLPSNLIKCILEYKPGELWISTGNGISRMLYEKYSNGNVVAKFRNFNQSDNLQDNFFWERSGCKTKNGNLIFGGEKGIILFNPENIKDNTEIPNVYITGFKLFNKPVFIGEFDSLLKHNINQTKEIKLKYYQNIISFNYVAINYISKENNRFAYKMEGFDSEWNYVENKREATYTNLDPGNYTFRVKACNNDGYWNEAGASINLIILPPFWITWWFRILLVLIILAIGSSYYFFRINILNQQKLILEQKVEERTHALSSANIELVEKNDRIVTQNEEILSKNNEIVSKNEEISAQKELLEEQKSKIEKAFDELSKYRNKLEEIVEERTRELIIAKDKAEESDRLKSSFLANLSHEIRTPLNAIIGFSSIIYEPNISEDDRQKYNSIIQSSSNTLLNLINDIIDFSKIEAGHLDIILREVSLSKIFSDIQEIFSLEIKKQYYGSAKQLEFIINLDEEIQSAIFLCDETRLKQILSNLINNAIKFTDKGYIEVGCKLIDKKILEFFIKDTGIGIPKEFIDIIFERFRKIENDNIHLYRGAGLGLSISQHLVRLLGGEIWVESNFGLGSIFYFSIPFNQSVGRKTSIQTIPTLIPKLNDFPILVAEDDFASYYYIEKLLQKTNAKILHARNGKEAIMIYESNKNIQLILMDIKMPDMNGIEALVELKRKDIQIPVIAQTAYAFYDDINRINEAGFTDYLLKPIISNDLYKMLYKYLKVIG